MKGSGGGERDKMLSDSPSACFSPSPKRGKKNKRDRDTMADYQAHDVDTT